MIDWKSILPEERSFKFTELNKNSINEGLIANNTLRACIAYLHQAELSGKICRCPTEEEIDILLMKLKKAILKLLKGEKCEK